MLDIEVHLTIRLSSRCAVAKARCDCLDGYCAYIWLHYTHMKARAAGRGTSPHIMTRVPIRGQAKRNARLHSGKGVGANLTNSSEVLYNEVDGC